MLNRIIKKYIYFFCFVKNFINLKLQKNNFFNNKNNNIIIQKFLYFLNKYEYIKINFLIIILLLLLFLLYKDVYFLKYIINIFIIIIVFFYLNLDKFFSIYIDNLQIIFKKYKILNYFCLFIYFFSHFYFYYLILRQIFYFILRFIRFFFCQLNLYFLINLINWILFCIYLYFEQIFLFIIEKILKIKKNLLKKDFKYFYLIRLNSVFFSILFYNYLLKILNINYIYFILFFFILFFFIITHKIIVYYYNNYILFTYLSKLTLTTDFKNQIINKKNIFDSRILLKYINFNKQKNNYNYFSTYWYNYNYFFNDIWGGVETLNLMNFNYFLNKILLKIFWLNWLNIDGSLLENKGLELLKINNTIDRADLNSNDLEFRSELYNDLKSRNCLKVLLLDYKELSHLCFLIIKKIKEITLVNKQIINIEFIQNFYIDKDFDNNIFIEFYYINFTFNNSNLIYSNKIGILNKQLHNLVLELIKKYDCLEKQDKLQYPILYGDGCDYWSLDLDTQVDEKEFLVNLDLNYKNYNYKNLYQIINKDIVKNLFTIDEFSQLYYENQLYKKKK